MPPIVDRIIGEIETISFKLFRLGENPDYEQPAERSLGAEAKRDGVPVMEKLYDVCLELDGRQLIYFPIYNYTEFSYDNVHTMLTHPNAVLGLSDGGAHVGTICDASFPAYLLAHWTRDREHGRIGLGRAIQMLTADAADYLGLADRGRIRPGQRADINVIDYDALSLRPPRNGPGPPGRWPALVAVRQRIPRDTGRGRTGRRPRPRNGCAAGQTRAL